MVIKLVKVLTTQTLPVLVEGLVVKRRLGSKAKGRAGTSRQSGGLMFTLEIMPEIRKKESVIKNGEPAERP